MDKIIILKNLWKKAQQSIVYGLLCALFATEISGCGKKAEGMTDSQGRTRLELAIVGDDYNLSELVLEFNKTQKDYYIETVEYN